MDRYYWYSFNLQKALAGTLVGLPATPNFTIPTSSGSSSEGTSADGGGDTDGDGETTDTGTTQPVFADSDLTFTGIVTGGPDPYYHVSLNGHKTDFDANGRIVACASLPEAIGKTLYLIEAELQQSIGATRADDAFVITKLTPRDQFAMQALSSMLAVMKRTDTFTDAAMLSICRTAYRWGEAMLAVATSKRDADDVDTTTTPTTTDDTSQQSGDGDTGTSPASDTGATMIAQAIDNLRNATLKIDNPSGEVLDTTGGGGALSFDQLPGELASDDYPFNYVLVFNTNQINAPDIPRVTRTDELLKRLKALDSQGAWLRTEGGVSNGLYIAGINTFLNAYEDEIVDRLKSYWRHNITEAIEDCCQTNNLTIPQIAYTDI